jgi:hypothetical protein
MQYDFALTPLGGQIINARGRFFKYRTGNGLIRVKLTDGAVIDLLPGQGVSNRNFESIEIIDKSGAINAGTILAGDFDFRDERITGTVDIVDGGFNRTKAGQAYMSGPGVSGADYSEVQIWNPAGSGKVLIVEAMTFSSNLASQIDFGISTVQLGTAYLAPLSKLAGGAASVALARVQNTAVRSAIQPLGLVLVQANGTEVVQLREPVLITPGYGLTSQNVNTNRSVLSTFEFIEQAL